jgi:hypothetical protein
MVAADLPYFAFETDLKPVPLTPTHCECGEWLEPLRRWGGKCKACVRSGARPVPLPTDQLRTTMTVVRTLFRQRTKHRERYVEVRCSCGRRRVLKWSTWVHEQPRCCNRCRLRGIDERGFEAEYPRASQFRRHE